MKLAAISPRTISFNQRTPERPLAGSTLRRAPERIATESRDARPLHLTPREREVLAQLGVASRLQAVVAAHRHGLVDDSRACDDEASFHRQPLEQALTGSAFQPGRLRAA